MDAVVEQDFAEAAAPEERLVASEPLGLARLLAGLGEGSMILAAHSEAQAARLVAAARALAPALRPVLLPGWDCLPFDRTSPSRAVMGLRMDALRLLATGEARLLVAPIETLAQRLPDPATLRTVGIAVGQVICRTSLLADLGRLGYAMLEEADQPGEAAAQGSVIDLVPGDGGLPVRIRLDGEEPQCTVASLDSYDTLTQRSRFSLKQLTIGPASEIVQPADSPDGERPPGLEHRLPELAGKLVDVFGLLPGAKLVLDADAVDRMAVHLRQLQEARAGRIALCRATGAALPAGGLYLTPEEWQARMHARSPQLVVWPETEALPVFREARRPKAAAEAFVVARLAAGGRVGLSGPRLSGALGVDASPVDSWSALLAMPPGSAGVLPAGIVRGFVSDEALVIGTGDVLAPVWGRADAAALFDVALRPGDTVIHLDYGMARLEGIETVQAGQPADCLVLHFAGDARKLVPCSELDRVWRYGAGTECVGLDRADGSSWRKRQGRILTSLEETAVGLVEQQAAQARMRAPAIRPPRREMERFVAGFRFTPTPDQEQAFSDIAADLARAHPMNRLLCGDVGFGKTEAALRAAAAVALSGRQVAILAPTTVLVRQHFSTFQRRLAGMGIEVAALSRLTGPAEARAIRERLADGTLRVVIGTHALSSPDIAFADLALVVIDEEQRFGTRAKTALAALRQGSGPETPPETPHETRPDTGRLTRPRSRPKSRHPGVHTLTLSATPIPRTLQGALTGLQSLSVLTTPPTRRQPVRTTVLPVDDAVLRTALMREQARGGQSFCVCPRIEDLDALAEKLGVLVPDLSVVMLHGKMKPDAMDAALVGFADGYGDVLLSTDIIETGLDIPRANTILIWRADLFGLAQLHQLRGRVGRGRTRAMAWLFTDPACPPGETASERLAALAAHDGLGAGFAVAARDLDIRGAGDLLGDTQAGHVKLLGVELARYLLGRAMARARGEMPEEEWRPETVLDLPGSIPADYMPDPAARIALHVRLAKQGDFAPLIEELEDRFGKLPDALRHVIGHAELRAACRELGIARLEVGPAAVAADMRQEPAEIDGVERKGSRLILRRPSTTPDERLDLARQLLRRIEGAQGG